ncbi:MAG TPA: hypothetical protein V6C85_10730 [Allocoleopsis sp.]
MRSLFQLTYRIAHSPAFSYEFERRYSAMPSLKKAELIEGIVYMPAALRFSLHNPS